MTRPGLPTPSAAAAPDRAIHPPFRDDPDGLPTHGPPPERTPPERCVLLGGLPEKARDRLEHRHALVRGFLHLRETQGLKGTDAAIAAAMDDIVREAERFMHGDLPAPGGEGRPAGGNRRVRPVPEPPSPRTLRNWVKRYREGGKAALCDRAADQGNRRDRLAPGARALLDRVVRAEYMTPQRKSVRAVMDDVRLAFRTENRTRAADGRPPLEVPSHETVRRHVRGLDAFHVMLARNGHTAALHEMRAVTAGLEATRPFERVEMDEWKVDLLTVASAARASGLFSEAEMHGLGLSDRLRRWWLVTAVDCRTRCIAGMTLESSPRTSGAIRCLDLVTRDKSDLAAAAGAAAPWPVHGAPELLVVDNGAAFRSGAFLSACADLGVNHVQTIAGAPQMRGRIERLFGTLASGLMPRLHGRTFSGPDARGDHPSVDRACLDVANLAQVLVRWVVDVYHNTPHAGLAGRTPLERWQADIADGNFPLKAPPDAWTRRLALGRSVTCRAGRDGLRVLNVRYHSERLARWVMATGGGEVRIRWFDGDIGAVGVEMDGAWHEVPAVPDALRGVDASTWRATRRALSARDPERHRWNGDTVLDAIRDITDMDAGRARAYGILDHAWTPERLENAEREALAPFDVVPAGEGPQDAADRGYGHDVEPSAPEPEREAPAGP